MALSLLYSLWQQFVITKNFQTCPFVFPLYGTVKCMFLLILNNFYICLSHKDLFGHTNILQSER
jgi:hypothetical protein